MEGLDPKKMACFAEAILAGAIGYREYHVVYKHKPYLFSTHFFIDNETEIAYFIEDMFEITGLFKFENPRVWSEHFLNSQNYTGLISLNS